MRDMNRWAIATAGVFLQIALGAVYAWSVFRIPLARQFGWSISEVTLTFTICIFVLGISAFFGGIFAPVSVGDSVFPSGQDFRRGDELIAAGEVLSPGKLALLAFAGRPRVRVFRRPRVSIVCTGNELVDTAATPLRGQVRNSNAVAPSRPPLLCPRSSSSRYRGLHG
jgi:hypothetical protein